MLQLKDLQEMCKSNVNDLEEEAFNPSIESTLDEIEASLSATDPEASSIELNIESTINGIEASPAKGHRLFTNK